RHPYASPLSGELTGLPPTLILVGSDEVLRDDAVRMADKMRIAGCSVEIEVCNTCGMVGTCLCASCRRPGLQSRASQGSCKTSCRATAPACCAPHGHWAYPRRASPTLRNGASAEVATPTPC